VAVILTCDYSGSEVWVLHGPGVEGNERPERVEGTAFCECKGTAGKMAVSEWKRKGEEKDGGSVDGGDCPIAVALVEVEGLSFCGSGDHKQEVEGWLRKARDKEGNREEEEEEEKKEEEEEKKRQLLAHETVRLVLCCVCCVERVL
jgi:hypothetical protein